MRRWIQLAISLLLTSVAVILAWRLLPPGALSAGLPHRRASDADDRVKLTVEEIAEIEGGRVHLVVLAMAETSNGPVLPLFVEAAEARRLSQRLANPGPGERDSDTLANAVHLLGGAVREVTIDDVEPLSSRGTVLLTQGDRELSMETSGANSVALALIEGAPITASRALFDSGSLDRGQLKKMRERLRNELAPNRPRVPMHNAPGQRERPDWNVGRSEMPERPAQL